MNKHEQISFIVVMTIFLVSTTLASLSSPSEPPTGSLSQKSSLQIERERIEAEMKRLNQPEVRRERQLLDDLNRALEKYLDSKDASSREQCESLIKQALALPKASPKAYSVCATTANVLGQPRRAIEILKTAIVKYPDERGWGTTLPLKVSGYYRIGSIATYIGDANEAARAYETIISNSQDLKTAKLFKVTSSMFLADIASKLLNDKHLAMKRNRETIEEIDSVNPNKLDHNTNHMFKFIRGWALYEQERLETGSAPSLQKEKLKKEEYLLPSMLAITHMSISQCSMPEMEQVAEADSNSINSLLIRYALAYSYMHHSNINPPKAEKYFLSVSETNTYFKPYAEAALDLVHEEEDRIRKKIPVLLSELKNGDLKQRDSAASKLIWQAGSEGIKVLEQAQQDPNKYVRYAAACNLARWGLDSSNKANFNIILEAFTDENPQIRNQAHASFSSYKCFKVGPEEIAALVKLMNEHYSTELRRTIESLLSSSKTSSDIKETGVSELAKLLPHEDPDVRSGVLEIFRRMRSSAAGAIPVLVERLDKEEQQDIQSKIIRILVRFGPDAKQAVPVLKKYLEHEDTNFRRHVENALRMISPAEADKLLKAR